MRPTVAEIDLSAIACNINKIKKHVYPAQVMAVVKADSYGHGAIACAKTAIENGVSYLGVALLEEGIELRNNGILDPVLVFGGAFENQLSDFFKYKLDVTVYTEEIAHALAKIARERKEKINVQIKIDTGMGRVGVAHDKAVSFIELVLQLEGIHLKGIYTHFATSDEANKDYAKLQFSRFEKILAEVERKNITIPLKHAANSGAILDLPETYLDMVRAGVMMYGHFPSRETSESVDIQPAMTLKSRIAFIKSVPAGTSVSYGRKFTTSKKTRIATIPMGYADGYNRLLTNRGMVTIHGKRYPVVGRVCMDLILIDLGDDEHIRVNDEVILFGGKENDNFTVAEICEIVDSIPYEVTCWISKRVPRIYKIIDGD